MHALAGSSHENHISVPLELSNKAADAVLQLPAFLGPRDEQSHVQLQHALPVQEGGQGRPIGGALSHYGVGQALCTDRSTPANQN